MALASSPFIWDCSFAPGLITAVGFCAWYSVPWAAVCLASTAEEVMAPNDMISASMTVRMEYARCLPRACQALVRTNM